MVKKTKSDLERVRDAVAKVFREDIGFKNIDENGEIIIDEQLILNTVDRDIYASEDDPGGWSPSAKAIINCERGLIPDGSYDDSGCILEKWFKVSELLGDLFCEHINSCIIGVYPS